MPMLDRPEGALFYDVCDIVPPWVEPKETILFHHGLAIDADIWVTWLPELAQRYRLVRPEMRGFGRSFVPEAGAPWEIGLLARDVLDVMKAVDSPRVHFVGESTGGTVGMYLAATHPEAVQTLTTVSAAHRGGSIRLARQLRDDVAALGMDDWSKKAMPLRFHEGAQTPEMAHWFHQVQKSSPPHVCVDLVNMLVGMDLTDMLPNIQAPTLILAPDDSPFVPVEDQVERLRAIPGSVLHIVAGSRHGVSHSHGVECARALRDFLQGHAGA